jgi:hypothetical protein
LGANESEPLLSMKENSFAYNNKTITFFNGYLDINNYSIEDLFPNITIPDILICSLCVVQLESAYVFRELCRQAAIICSSKYSSKQIIKYEKADEIDNDSLVYNELVSDENNPQKRLKLIQKTVWNQLVQMVRKNMIMIQKLRSSAVQSVKINIAPHKHLQFTKKLYI